MTRRSMSFNKKISICLRRYHPLVLMWIIKVMRMFAFRSRLTLMHTNISPKRREWNGIALGGLQTILLRCFTLSIQVQALGLNRQPGWCITMGTVGVPTLRQSAPVQTASDTGTEEVSRSGWNTRVSQQRTALDKLCLLYLINFSD